MTGFVCVECERTWPTKDRHENDGRYYCPECIDEVEEDDDDGGHPGPRGANHYFGGHP